jgi:hypothetical protein
MKVDVKSAPTRILSLDFDGVLHPGDEDLPEHGRFCWLPVLEELLAAHPDVGLAVHSTWRYTHTDEEIRDLLGPALGSRYCGKAPRGPREESVMWFMHLSNCQDYLVVDDSPHEFGELPPHRLVVCDAALGLSDEGARAGIEAWLAGIERA